MHAGLQGDTRHHMPRPLAIAGQRLMMSSSVATHAACGN